MKSIEIAPDIYWIGVNDRTTDLFEGLWPISDVGVSYNSYIIKDEKTVLIDLAKALKTDAFLEQISEVTALDKIDYIVINHVEPDHTGVLKIVKLLAPQAVILCTPKAATMLEQYYHISNKVVTVADGETLSIGKRTLKFVHIPFVHWPETMATYEATEGVLFSCDAFGGYGALEGSLFDDECGDLEYYKRESLRYFVNIIAKFCKPVLNAIAKLEGVPVKTIAPSHGLVWRKNPEAIIALYKEWASLAGLPGSAGVPVLYGSMYGNTEQLMNAVVQGIRDAGIPVKVFDCARTHASYILPELWKHSGVMIGAPTYEGGLFPPMSFLLQEAALKRVMGKTAAMFGSYGWSGGALREIKAIVEPLKWELSQTMELAGGPTEDSLKQARAFGLAFAQCLKK